VGHRKALHEETLVNHNFGRIMNANFAEYHVPVNADVHDIKVIFVDEPDDIINPLGIKGLGEPRKRKASTPRHRRGYWVARFRAGEEIKDLILRSALQGASRRMAASPCRASILRDARNRNRLLPISIDL
jgi:hypothetical protein